MSLGGYTGALAATIEPRLAFCVPIVPLASIADFARQHGRLSRAPKQAAIEHAALDRALARVSPLHRGPVIAPHRMLVVGARSDRITPVEHAQRLAHHFGARMLSWPGGRFAFALGQPLRGTAIRTRFEQLLLEGLRRLDEQRRYLAAPLDSTVLRRWNVPES